MSVENKILIVVPARYGSTRLPGKPLLCGTGKPLIQHVYERVARIRLPARIVVATDDERIFSAVVEFGGQAVMTSRDCRSGTDRAFEVAQAEPAAELIVNVQGDEPEIDPRNVETLIALLRMEERAARSADIATLACPFADRTEFADPAKVKVVLVGKKRMRVASAKCFGDAMYFSRAMIPHVVDDTRAGASASRRVPAGVYRHLGLYAFRRQALFAFALDRETELEKSEKLEQLRALENGMRIRVGVVRHAPGGIDTPQDYAAFVNRCRREGK
jgi:3-deoxy-manno-octulosonate cytidylyltransferase (CMP-KDO synthetase)